jgi:hypothetical protein
LQHDARRPGRRRAGRIGRLGPDAAAALKEEARRRAGAGEFFGFIAFASFIARKPSS